MTKTTKLDNFTAIRNFLTEQGKEEWASVIAHEVELLEKRKSADRKPTKAQEANTELGKAILEGMADGISRTVTDVIKTFPCCEGFSTQKVSPIMNRLVEAGKLTKTEEKRRTLFTIVKGE